MAVCPRKLVPLVAVFVGEIDAGLVVFAVQFERVAASNHFALQRSRSNNSFKPSPLRGLGHTGPQRAGRLNSGVRPHLEILVTMEKKFVYVIGPTGGPLKIGIADDCKTRRSILNVGNPLYLRLWHVVEAANAAEAAQIEKSVHHQYRESHIRGEWFQLTEKDLPGIRQAMHVATLFVYDLNDWSLERKSCDEFTSSVCSKARRALDLSQQDLASRANISLQTLAGFESGSSCPQLDTLEALRNALEDGGVEFIREQAGQPMKILV